MKVFLLLRSKPHPDRANPNAPQIGDIVEFSRADRTDWGEELKHFTIALVDLNIPCGDLFKRVDQGWNCKKCEFNHPDKCDAQKLLQPKESMMADGRVLAKRRYQVRFSPPAVIKAIIDKAVNKTKAEEARILAWARANEFRLADILHDKVMD